MSTPCLEPLARVADDVAADWGVDRMELRTTERRLAAFAAAGLDEGRMRKWTLIRGAYLGADEDETRVLRSLVGR